MRPDFTNYWFIIWSHKTKLETKFLAFLLVVKNYLLCFCRVVLFLVIPSQFCLGNLPFLFADCMIWVLLTLHKAPLAHPKFHLIQSQ